MTKGRSMISDLKLRTLSLFRRSSNGSTQSASTASSAHSDSDQHLHSSQHSPTVARKRPSSARSRSSLIVPRLKAALADGFVHKAGESQSTHEAPPSAPGSSPSEALRPRSSATPDPPTAAPLHLPAAAGKDQFQDPQSSELSTNIYQHKAPAVRSPLPLPTPEPSPLGQPARVEALEAPQLNVQPSTPEKYKSTELPAGNTSIFKAPQAGAEHVDATKEEKGSERSRQSLQLDLDGRNRAVSAGKRSLLESRPRSPLHQSSTPGQVVSVGFASGIGQLTGQADQSARYGRRPSQDIEPSDYFSSLPASPRNPRTPPAMAISPSRYPQQFVQMQQPRKRKIWVKRPGASATMVAINEDDMVDDARDMILRKYANSLGKSFDSPDVMLRIHPREQPVSASQRSTPSPLLDERSLRPDEVLCRTIDVYFPGGQSVEEALTIDTPAPIPGRSRRTPKHSPGVHSTHYGYYGNQYEDTRPTESDKDYFPPMVIAQPLMNGQPSPRPPGTLPVVAGHHSIAVLNGAPLPTLPSPSNFPRDGIVAGSNDGGKRRHGDRRPKFVRTHTSSPTIVQHSDRQPVQSATIPQPSTAISTPPHAAGSNINSNRVATPPPPRVSSPRPKPKRGKKPSMSGSISGLSSPHASGLLASVPPINVLVVEDNIINLKVLQAFLKRLKVRTHSAKDGREAVAKWREGGFHLVLMDIQLPLMNGLEATKEIRRLERVNGVGAFVKSAEEEKLEKGSERPGPAKNEGSDDSVLQAAVDKERERNRIGKKELFKSPVIIVALTASSLHSDRSEALAAGCNDFLTKPVNLTWLERKLKEWGCMQALIDFDGWRQWKDFQSPTTATSAASPKLLQEAQIKSLSIVNTPSKLSASDSIQKSPSNGHRPANGSISALQGLESKVEGNDSTATIDSMTSDDCDSLDTAMPIRSRSRTFSSHGTLSPTGPALVVQEPTPRQSIDSVPQIGDVASSPKMRSPANSIGASSPKIGAQPSIINSDDGSLDRPRRKRAGTGHSRGLSAVGEESDAASSHEVSQRIEVEM